MRPAPSKYTVAALVSLGALTAGAGEVLAVGPISPEVFQADRKPLPSVVHIIDPFPTPITWPITWPITLPILFPTMPLPIIGFHLSADPTNYSLSSSVFSNAATADFVADSRATFASAVACAAPTVSAGGFEIEMSNPINEGGYSCYVLSALNTGGSEDNSTGSRLLGVDLKITTPGSGADGAIRLTGPEELAGGELGSDVLGKDGEQFGDIDGTFIGIASSYSNGVSGNMFSFSLNTAGQFGSFDGITSTRDLHTLEVVGVIPGAAYATPDANAYVPFANIVVPTGTAFDAQGALAGEIGSIQPFNLSFLGTPTLQTPQPVQFQAAAVPEPACAGLLLGALTAGSPAARSRRKRLARCSRC